MVSLASKIAVLKPNADPIRDYRIVAVDDVQSIAFWDSQKLGSMPTDEELAAAAKVVFKQQIAETRYQKEIGGIVVGDQPVSTNRDEMPIWQGMLLDISMRPGQTATYEYKPRGGENTTLTPQQVGRVYECFAWYVQACFATERALCGMLDAGASIEAVEAALQNANTWPQTSFNWSAG